MDASQTWRYALVMASSRNLETANRRGAHSKAAFGDADDFHRILALGGFALALIAFGGSSRPDAIQTALLRPLSALLLLLPLLWWQPRSLGRLKPLVLWLLALALIMVAQLIPLPTGFWTGLPVRSSVVELDQLILGERIWRPISLVPGRTLNALFGLIVPCVALIMAVRYFSSRNEALVLIAALVTVDALLGVGQVISGKSSALYLYAKTNPGAPVGIFANENHSAAFSAMGFVVVANLGLLRNRNDQPPLMLVWFGFAAALAALSIVISSSRSGLILGLFAILSSVAVYGIRATGLGEVGRVKWSPRLRLSIFAAFALSLIMLVSAFVLLDRSPAYLDILGRDTFAELRWQLAPVFQKMIADFWLIGSGFGSFEEVYHFYEPTELLMRQYVNQAHNDWVQFVIEGGLVSLIVLVAFLIWLARALAGQMRTGGSSTVSAILWCSMFLIVSAASLVDYPLRTPTFQAVAVWLIASLLLGEQAASEARGDQP